MLIESCQVDHNGSSKKCEDRGVLSKVPSNMYFIISFSLSLDKSKYASRQGSNPIIDINTIMRLPISFEINPSTTILRQSEELKDQSGQF